MSKMAVLEEDARVLVDQCEWRVLYRPDGSSYRRRVKDCQVSTCRWSDNYIGRWSDNYIGR
ncbi:hypothetical protein A9K55_006748 [Cordyceps militaris]|nr:hypothetical protein A9K55_006748 [Cordyceps militaris]